MSIVVSIKLHDGVVMAADSSVHVYQTVPDEGPKLIKQYSNGQRLFRIKNLQIGLVTHGLSNLGPRSVTSLMQEFLRVKGANYNENIGVQDIFQTLFYVMKEKYDQVYNTVPMHERPELGFIISGYSKNDLVAQEFEFVLPHDLGVKRVKEQHFFGMEWRGTAMPFQRLHRGYDGNLLKEITTRFNLDIADVMEVASKYEVPVIYGGMPLTEAAEYARHILLTTINNGRFDAGQAPCSAPIHIAVITKEKYTEVEAHALPA